MLLHQQDSSLLMLNPVADSTVLHVDLNRPDIVEKWV
jgi:hypothetical protein